MRFRKFKNAGRGNRVCKFSFLTIKQPHYGSGSLSSGCPVTSRSQLIIQRSRWYGRENLGTVTVNGSGYEQSISYDCAGTRKHDRSNTIYLGYVF
ncbi:MAG: hypothetical protein KME43_04860 [Myxacorys chilensis ATA2-1-KO14]|nr:hypothetical protein [Myxacorys chilensis ATA2-1-KO14]